MTLPEKMPMDEERVLFYVHHSYAIAQWVSVESHLWNIVSHCFQQRDRPIIGTGYAAVTGFHPKMQFADAAVVRTLKMARPDFAGPLLEKWEVLSDRLRTLSNARNALVHWQVGEFEEGGVEGRRIALCPWINKKGQDKTRPPQKSMCLMEIVKARLEFVAMGVRLQNYLAEAVSARKPLPESDEQAPDPPTIRELRLLIHEALGYQHLSSRELRARQDAENAAASLRTPQPQGSTNGIEEVAILAADGGRGADTVADQPAEGSRPPEGREKASG